MIILLYCVLSISVFNGGSQYVSVPFRSLAVYSLPLTQWRYVELNEGLNGFAWFSSYSRKRVTVEDTIGPSEVLLNIWSLNITVITENTLSYIFSFLACSTSSKSTAIFAAKRSCCTLDRSRLKNAISRTTELYDYCEDNPEHKSI